MNATHRWLVTLTVIAIAGASGPPMSSAQVAPPVPNPDPWSIGLVPTLNPLPVGYCGAVQLTIFNSNAAGGDVPRNPTGVLVQMADFDMAVSGAFVAGQHLDAYHFVACACQGGAPGTIGTVTATYPAQRLAANARVPGVAFQRSATFVLAMPVGTVNPPACVVAATAPPPAAPAAQPPPSPPPTVVGVTPIGPAVVRTPASAPAPVVPPAAPPAIAAADMPVTSLPSSLPGRQVPAAPAVKPPAAGASGADGPLAVAPPGTPAPRTPAAGAPPQNVAVTGTPLIARLTWTAAPNATRYAVWRNDAAPVSVERSTAALTATQFTDTLPDPRITYRYTVIAHYADGTSGEAPAVPYVSPPMVNPTGFTAGFTAAPGGGGTVTLSWQVVPGAVQYRLHGPGIPGTGRHVTATTATVAPVPAGPGTWKVTALYPGNFADYTTSTLAQAMVRVLPARATPWLAKNNGPGSLVVAQAHASQLCGTTVYCLGPVKQLLGETKPPFVEWGNPFQFDLAYDQTRYEAVYGNTEDLGFGRRTDCKQWMLAPPEPGIHTICYATSHGPPPGASGFGNPQVITEAANGVNFTYSGAVLHDPWGGMPRSATMIIQSPKGTTFLAMTPGVWDLSRGAEQAGLSWEPGWAQFPQLTHAIAMDTEGPKPVPHSCIACHGGRYNATTKRVDGASLLPLDPGLLVFSGPPPGGAEYQAEWIRNGKVRVEERIRKINMVVANSAPSAAVKNYIQGLYNGAVAQPYTQAVTDYVPAGWAPQAGFYRSVVKPYCAMCHLAAPANVSFSSWGNFEQNKAAIHTAVCKTHTMPNAEIPFTQFWLKDTGPLFLPGLLAATLGFASCE